MTINMEKPYVVGMDIGGTNTVFGIVDSRGNVLATDSVKTQSKKYSGESPPLPTTSSYSFMTQEAWERTRMLMYAVVQVNSRDHLTPDALLPFPWDEDREPIEINMDEVNELRQRAKKFEHE